MDIQTVTVIGANGTMGCNISGIFASFGGAKVYMAARDMKKAEAACVKAAQTVKAGSVANRMVPIDYSQLPKCIAESDLIFESVFEDLEIKKEMASIVASSMRKDAVACTGTSGLSITTLAEQYPEDLRSRFFGIHMFNPPYNLNLCELIPTKYSDNEVMNELGEYLKNTLFRTVVKVKDAPAFLGNRIGFQFMNEVLRCAQKNQHSGGIDYVDAILGGFSGRSMAPLVTVDFVGLDIHKAIVDNIYALTSDYDHESFRLPGYVQQLINEGKLGRKSGGGLYKTILRDDGKKLRLVYDIQTDAYREVVAYQFPFAKRMIEFLRVGDYQSAFTELVENHSVEAQLCLQFLLKYVVYGICAADLVGYDIEAADHVMATGFNWCPPLAIADALGTVTDFKALVRERLDFSDCGTVDLDRVLSLVKPSLYDYRPFFKAKR